MENGTKALLIAAVLIVIVIVTLGVNLLSSTGDTTQKAEQVGEELKDTMESVSSDLEDDFKFDLKKLYKKLGKGNSKAPDRFSKQLEKVYLCRYEGTSDQADKGPYPCFKQIEKYIEGKEINPYFSIIPVKLTTNDIYKKILEINPKNKTVGITTTDTSVHDSENKYKILVIVVCTDIAH